MPKRCEMDAAQPGLGHTLARIVSIKRDRSKSRRCPRSDRRLTMWGLQAGPPFHMSVDRRSGQDSVDAALIPCQGECSCSDE